MKSLLPTGKMVMKIVITGNTGNTGNLKKGKTSENKLSCIIQMKFIIL